MIVHDEVDFVHKFIVSFALHIDVWVIVDTGNCQDPDATLGFQHGFS